MQHQPKASLQLQWKRYIFFLLVDFLHVTFLKPRWGVIIWTSCLLASNFSRYNKRHTVASSWCVLCGVMPDVPFLFREFHRLLPQTMLTMATDEWQTEIWVAPLYCYKNVGHSGGLKSVKWWLNEVVGRFLFALCHVCYFYYNIFES